MNAGVVKSKYKKSELDKAIQEYKETALPAIATHEGGRSATLLVNRDTGDVLSIAFYKDEASAKAFGPKAEKLIAAFQKYAAPDARPMRGVYDISASHQSETTIA